MRNNIYKEFFNNNFIMHLLLDMESNKILDCNESFLNKLNFEEKDLKEKKFIDLFHPNSKAKSYQENMYTQLNLKFFYQDDVILLSLNGDKISIAYVAHLINDENGKKLICLNIQDISTQIKNNREMIENKILLSELIETAPYLLLIYNENQLDHVNIKFLHFFNVNSISSFFENYVEIDRLFIKKDGYISKDMYEDKCFLEYLLENKNKSMKVLIEKNGIEFSFLLICTKIQHLNEEKYILRLLDITYMEKVNEDISKLKDLYNNVINSIENLIFFKDEQFRYLGCNKAYEYFTGKSLIELLNKTDEEIFGKNENNLTLDSKLKYIKNNSCYSESKWVTDFQKNEKFFHTVVSPMYNNTQVRGIVSNSTDLTKQKQLENIMVTQSKHAAMGEMIGMIAHQWRQPITAISMGANNMIVDIDLDDANLNEFRNISTEIITQTQYLSKTIDDFRNFFKPNSKKEVTQVDVLIEESFSMLTHILSTSDVKIYKEYSCIYDIVTFKGKLLQVFINIIKNAVDALISNRKNNRKLYVNTKELEESLVINIKDNAGGIKRDVISKIFDPYFTTKGDSIGTGLGLYMSKTIIEKHLDGRISVDNIEDGCCFTITIKKPNKQIKLNKFETSD